MQELVSISLLFVEDASKPPRPTGSSPFVDNVRVTLHHSRSDYCQVRKRKNLMQGLQLAGSFHLVKGTSVSKKFDGKNANGWELEMFR